MLTETFLEFTAIIFNKGVIFDKFFRPNVSLVKKTNKKNNSKSVIAENFSII